MVNERNALPWMSDLLYHFTIQFALLLKAFADLSRLLDVSHMNATSHVVFVTLLETVTHIDGVQV
jgi:hypothetical protein